MAKTRTKKSDKPSFSKQAKKRKPSKSKLLKLKGPSRNPKDYE